MDWVQTEEVCRTERGVGMQSHERTEAVEDETHREVNRKARKRDRQREKRQRMWTMERETEATAQIMSTAEDNVDNELQLS